MVGVEPWLNYDSDFTDCRASHTHVTTSEISLLLCMWLLLLLLFCCAATLAWWYWTVTQSGAGLGVNNMGHSSSTSGTVLCTLLVVLVVVPLIYLYRPNWMPSSVGCSTMPGLADAVSGLASHSQAVQHQALYQLREMASVYLDDRLLWFFMGSPHMLYRLSMARCPALVRGIMDVAARSNDASVTFDVLKLVKALVNLDAEHMGRKQWLVLQLAGLLDRNATKGMSGDVSTRLWVEAYAVDALGVLWQSGSYRSFSKRCIVTDEFIFNLAVLMTREPEPGLGQGMRSGAIIVKDRAARLLKRTLLPGVNGGWAWHTWDPICQHFLAAPDTITHLVELLGREIPAYDQLAGYSNERREAAGVLLVHLLRYAPDCHDRIAQEDGLAQELVKLHKELKLQRDWSDWANTHIPSAVDLLGELKVRRTVGTVAG